MTLSDSAKGYLKAFEFLAVFVLIIWWSSRPDKDYCKHFTNYVRNEKFHLVLKKIKDPLSRYTYLDGIGISSKKDTEYSDNSGWISHIIDTFKVGDTLLKDSGSTTMIIKRQGKSIPVHFICDSITNNITH